MNNSEKNLINCQVCGRGIDTSKERIYKVMEDENAKGLKICEKDWKKASEQYLEKYSIVYRFYTGKEVNGLEFVKIKGKCPHCKKTFLFKEVDLNEKNDLCYECRLADKKPETTGTNKKPTEVEQQPTTETDKKPEGISGGVVVLIILTVASILGGIVYYLWKMKKNK